MICIKSLFKHAHIATKSDKTLVFGHSQHLPLCFASSSSKGSGKTERRYKEISCLGIPYLCLLKTLGLSEAVTTGLFEYITCVLEYTTGAIESRLEL